MVMMMVKSNISLDLAIYMGALAAVFYLFAK